MNTNLIMMMTLGCLTAVMSQLKIAVFNDGLRSMISEYNTGRIDKSELVLNSLSISIGIIISFGIPISLAGQIIIVHTLLLATDFIGIWVIDGKFGVILAAILGGIYSFVLFQGLDYILNIITVLPVNFISNLAKIGEPVIAIMFFLPILTIAYQYNIKRAVYSFLIVLFLRLSPLFINRLELWSLESKVADNLALAAGILILLYFAFKEGKVELKEGEGLTNLISDKVNRFKKYLPLFAVTGALLGVAAVSNQLAANPMSLELQRINNLGGVTLIYFTRAFIFMPLVVSTAIVTGIYSPAGTKLLFSFAFLVYLLSGNLILTAIISGLTIIVEILLLEKIALLFDIYPGLKMTADNMRTAFVKLLEISLLIGGALSAQSIMPKTGLFIVIILYFFNEQAQQPIKKMALGPTAAILVGIIANIAQIIKI